MRCTGCLLYSRCDQRQLDAMIACQCPLARLVTLEVDRSLWRDPNSSVMSISRRQVECIFSFSLRSRAEIRPLSSGTKRPRILPLPVSRGGLLCRYFLQLFKQLITDWAHSCVRRAVWLTESNSIPRKEILCIGESLLFSQLTRRPNRLRCESTKSLCSHNWSWDWASMSQSSR